MNKKLKFLLIVTICCLLIFSVVNHFQTTIKDYEIALEEKDDEITSHKKSIIKLESSLADMNNSIGESKSVIAKLNEEIEKIKKFEAYRTIKTQFYSDYYWRLNELLIMQSDLLVKYDISDYFTFYGGDANAEHVIRHFFVENPKNETLEVKLKLVADNLSKYSFGGYPIEFLRIEVIDGKKIAFVDFRDPDDQDNAWVINFFQGSSSGVITADIFIETFLQKETHINSWIDGVHFSFEGEMDWISDHDPSLCRYIYFRDGTELEDQ